MPAIKYRVTLTDDEVEMLEAMLRKGKCAARKQTRARILLKAAAGCKDAEIIEALAVSATMIHHTRQRCVEEGVEAARHRAGLGRRQPGGHHHGRVRRPLLRGPVRRQRMRPPPRW